MTWRWIRRAVAIVLAASSTGTATAAWLRAETTHFIVYSEDKAERVQELATDLQQFDSVLRRFHKTAEQDGASSNKLTVFVVDDAATVQRLCGGCPNVLGFYVGRASGSVAFTPRDTGAESRNDLSARNVLFHEYAHHFLFGNYAVAYPSWFSEGYAEFASTVRRGKTGMMIGAPAQHRAYGLFSEQGLSATRLFDPSGRRLNDLERESIYGRGWLLTHYIMFDDGRRAQFAKYLDLFNAGTPSVAAATQAFGDLKELDRALDRYLRARTLKVLTMAPGTIPVPAVTIRQLSPGEAAMLDFRIASTRGVNGKTAKPLYEKARAVAARYPDDPVVQGWLAEMAADAGDLDAADAAADRALVRDPKSAQALLYKGYVAIRRAKVAKAPPAAWAAARTFFVRANRLDADNAMPLLAYYEGFVSEGREPTKNAVAGLLRAQELAPQDRDLRFAAVAQLVRDGDLPRARQLLRPLAYDPHGAATAQYAKLLEALDAAKGKQEGIAALDALTATDKAAPKAD